MIHRPRRLITSALTLPALLLAGCTSSSTPAERSGPSTPTSVSASPTATAARTTAIPTSTPTSRYVPVGQNHGVRVIPLPTRFHRRNGIETDDAGIPNHLVVGTAARVAIDVYRGDTTSPPTGVTFTVINGYTDCGPAFLATQGHGYIVSCDVTALGRGTVKVTVAEHDEKSGARGSFITVPIPAR